MSDTSTQRSRKAGVEGKWMALNEENEALRIERDQLSSEVQHLQEENDDIKSLLDVDLAAELLELQTRLENLPTVTANELLKLNDDEQEAMDSIQNALKIISHKWRLIANHDELIAAVHTMQAFVVQHMISRQASTWSNWWETPAQTMVRQNIDRHEKGKSV